MSSEAAASFAGFRPLEANFTVTPNEFFDKVLPHQPLCVVTVVGLLIRATNGWHDSVTGEKRVEADMSYADFVRAGMSRGSAQNGVKAALEAGFIVITAEHSNREKRRYAIRWADDNALKTAVIRQRKANDDTRPLSEALESGVPFFGIPKSGTPKSGIPKNGTHINKGNSRKESVIDLSVKKSLNVCQTDIDRLFEQLDTPGQTLNEENRDLFIYTVLQPVHEVVEFTGDRKSLARYIQLREICIRHNQESAWSKTFGALRQRKARSTSTPVGNMGAWFNHVMRTELEKRNIHIPKKSELHESEEVRGLIAASLGLTFGGDDE